jgi:hypothetical protein
MKKRKDFATQKNFFTYLVTNKRELIDLKKTGLKHTQPQFGAQDDLNQIPIFKSLNTSYKDDVSSGVIKRTIIGNTYNWMDSVNDVLLNGVFAKSLSERADKVWHLHDHVHMITAKVGKPTSIYEKSVAWKDLGVDRKGDTQSLFMDSEIIKAYNEFIFNQYLNKEINQHSVGMRYVALDLAVNDKDMKAEYAVWNKYIDIIGNKELTMEDGFFWAVKEGMLVEISAVLAGANELTPTVDNDEKTDPKDDVQEKIIQEEEKGLDYKYLCDNFKL